MPNHWHFLVWPERDVLDLLSMSENVVNHWHFLVWPERDGDLPAFMQQVTNTHVKRWKEHRHEIGYGHWGSSARFGPVEDRRNNRRLATFT